MFEKEAEEWWNNEYSPSLYDNVSEVWQKGAEVGYNKAKEEGKVVVEHFEAYGQCRDSRRIASLEKENAELKEINADLKQSLDWANEREREDVKRITELEKENAELKAYNEKLLESDIEKHNKIAELEKEISNLLSCKNCPENKGGYICQKEYEDKCLAQKIQYIKELQEENADIKEKRDYYKDMADTANKVYNDNLDYSWYLEGQLTQAKDLLKKLCDETRSYINDQGFDIEILTEAEQFLKENK